MHQVPELWTHLFPVSPHHQDTLQVFLGLLPQLLGELQSDGMIIPNRRSKMQHRHDKYNYFPMCCSLPCNFVLKNENVLDTTDVKNTTVSWKYLNIPKCWYFMTLLAKPLFQLLRWNFHARCLFVLENSNKWGPPAISIYGLSFPRRQPLITQSSSGLIAGRGHQSSMWCNS